MSAPIVKGGFTQEQIDHVRKLIFEGIGVSGQNAQEQITKANQALIETARQFETGRAEQLEQIGRTTAETEAKQQQVLQHQPETEQNNTDMMIAMGAREAEVQRMINLLSAHAEQKGAIIAELDAKQQEISALK